MVLSVLSTRTSYKCINAQVFSNENVHKSQDLLANIGENRNQSLRFSHK